MNDPTPNHKRIAYGSPKGLNSHIAKLVKKGWRVVKTEVDKWANGKRVYIAELEKG